VNSGGSRETNREYKSLDHARGAKVGAPAEFGDIREHLVKEVRGGREVQSRQEKMSTPIRNAAKS